MTTTLQERSTAGAVTTMRAAVVHEFGDPLVVEDVPKPSPGAGQVVVKVEASGLCHTDIHAAHGDWPVKPTPPFTPGHEGVGIVEAVGEGVHGVAVGDRVAMPWLGYACGVCDYCISPKAFEQASGSLRRGGTLVFVGLPAENTIELPIFETVLNGFTGVGSIVGTRVDLRRGLRASRRRQNEDHPRGAAARGHQRGDRRGRGRPRPREDRVQPLIAPREAGGGCPPPASFAHCEEEDDDDRAQEQRGGDVHARHR